MQKALASDLRTLVDQSFVRNLLAEVVCVRACVRACLYEHVCVCVHAFDSKGWH
jgi:hypothetical protein